MTGTWEKIVEIAKTIGIVKAVETAEAGKDGTKNKNE